MSICSLAFLNVSVLQVHRMAASHHTILPWKTLASSWRHAKVGTSVGHRWILLLATDGYFNLATDIRDGLRRPARSPLDEGSAANQAARAGHGHGRGSGS